MNKKTTHSIKYKILTYSRIQTYVPTEHQTKACFCNAEKNNTNHSLNTMTISHTIDWYFFSLAVVGLFLPCMNVYGLCECVHCFTRDNCVLKMEFQSVTTVFSWNLWQCHCQNVPSPPPSFNGWIHWKLYPESNVNCNFAVHFCSFPPHTLK